MPEAQAPFPVELEIPVAWGDMDAFGHVNNTVYLRWFESGRIAYFGAAGMGDQKTATGIGPILARSTCNFRIPLEYPDTITIGARVSKLGNTSFTMTYEVRSHAHDRSVAAEGEGIIVMFDYEQGVKVAIPPALRQRIEALEATPRRRDDA